MTCCLPPGTTGACCIGEWDPLPYQPPFSCGVPGTPACLGCQNDEIAHAALIPVGNWHMGIPPDQTTADIRGMVVLWTRCDDRPGYKTHLWDPNDPGGIAFQSSILEKINPPNEGLEDGPFCSGHVWILDANKNPKLLTVGGQDRGDNNSATPEAFEDQDPGTPGIQNPCIGTGASFCGLHKVYWFDPLVLDPDNAWSDAPEDLTLGLWYPSVTTLLDASGTQFLPLVFGGSPRAYQYGCDSPVQTQSWWTSSGLGGAWATHGSSYYWHYYPRPFQLTDGTLLSAGHAILCEDNVPTNPFGGNPVSVITSAHVRSAGPSPNPDDTNLATATAGGWNYCNAAILHTLNDFSYTEVDPLSHYDLDRVLVTGGSQQLYDNGLPVPAQPYTHEYVGGQWVVKASPIQPRVYASWVTLPDRTLLLVGGSSHQYQENSERYYSSVERFAPQGPTAPGVWSPMAPRPSVPGYSDAPARGYHHVSLLLQDGRVAVMGGSSRADSHGIRTRSCLGPRSRSTARRTPSRTRA